MPFSSSVKRQRRTASLPRFEADARAVAGIRARALERDVLDGEIAVANDPDRLAFRYPAFGFQHRRAADAADRQPLLQPHGDVAAIVAGRDLDDVAVARDPRRRGNRPDRPVRASR